MKAILTAFRARPRWQRRLIKGALFLAFVIGVFVLPYQFWLMKVAQFLIVTDELEKCDVIVALAYPRDMRVRHAIRLYQQGYGNYVAFNFGVGPRTHVPNIFRNDPKDSPHVVARGFATEQGVPPEKVIVQDYTTGTFEEAVQLKKLMRRRGFRSAIIVTSALHTRRAAMVFHKVFRGENVRLLFYGVPVEEEKMSLDRWWTREDELITINNEWIKLVFYFFKYYLRR
ncbi:MAG: YdcF family protein [Abditibacteriales bacterium]|nr:YdcF family protein [Abditibacteriales bacterium]MDW8364227.1 YdcF family protein [Abditibacteriales bacterium]